MNVNISVFSKINRKKNIYIEGYIFAFCAAICNSTIGLLTKFALLSLDFYQIAFYKCLFAFIIVTLFASHKIVRKQIYQLFLYKKQISFLAFCGIFMLYFFETKALALASVANVILIIYATGILTIFMSYVFLKEQLTFKKICGALTVISGGSIMHFEYDFINNISSIVYSLIGGLGLCMFMIFCRKFRISANLGFLWWLTGFGTIFLFFPVLFTDMKLLFPTSGIKYLIALSIIPTLCGFYFTARALNRIEAGRVQIIEMSDPVFSTITAYIILEEGIGVYCLIGSIIVILGLIVSK